MNTLALRVRVAGGESFRELLGRVREAAIGGYAHQDVPFERVVEELQPERSLSHTPLFQVMMVLQNAPHGELALSGLTLQPLDIEHSTSKFDLLLSLGEKSDQLQGYIEYNNDLFNRATIERMLDHFKSLLESAVARPEERISELPLLTTEECHRLLFDWNNTATDFPKDVCIHKLFEQQAERSPDAMALMYEGQSLTYRQLNERANQLAHYLQSREVKPETRVGLFMERSLEMVVGMLAIIKAGGAYVPLDASWPLERVASILKDAGATILLTQRHLLTTIPAGDMTLLSLDDGWETFEQESKENPSSPVIPENAIYVIYTSGSTGAPKGVVVEHQQMLNYVHAIRERLELPSVVNFALVSTLAADLGYTVLYPSLCTGGCLHIISAQLTADSRAFSDYFKQHSIDCLKITPSHLASLLKVVDEQIVISCRHLILGGETCHWTLVETIRELMPNSQIHNHYGPTETTVGVSTYPTQEGSKVASSTVPLGKPLANEEIYILDKQLQPVPVGLAGELYIGGKGLSRGYLNRAEFTAERFIPNPHGAAQGGRLYRTGDKARYLPDGNIEFLGRFDHQVKVRGYRIELGEIEVLLAAHPDVAEAVVVARDETVGGKQLVAYVTADRGAAIDIGQLRGYLRGHLPEYMVPAAFVVIDAIPLTSNGKVDRRALPAPPQRYETASAVYEAPRTDIEKSVVHVWQEVLQLESVGLNENFFDLGGHSLLIPQVLIKLYKATGKKASLVDLFMYPTVSSLVKRLNDGEEQDISVSEISESAKRQRMAINRRRPPRN